MTHSWKIRKLNAKLDGKPLAELIRLDERLIVAIDGENKKMKAFKIFDFEAPETTFPRVLNDVEFEDF